MNDTHPASHHIHQQTNWNT